MDKKPLPPAFTGIAEASRRFPTSWTSPNLIAIQTESFDWFKNEGLAQAFADVCPIENNTGDHVRGIR